MTLAQFVIVGFRCLPSRQQKETKSDLEVARTFGTLFSNVSIRRELLEADNEDSFREILSRAGHQMAELHSKKEIKLEVPDEGPVSLFFNVCIVLG